MNNFKFISALILILHSSSSLKSTLTQEPISLDDVTDTFDRISIKHRGKLNSSSGDERALMSLFCELSATKIERLCTNGVDFYNTLAIGLEEDSGKGRIMRTCEGLPDVIKQIPDTLASTLKFWNDRLRFLAHHFKPTEAAHFPFSVQTDGELLRTEELKQTLLTQRAMLLITGHFLQDLNEILQAGILSKVDILGGQTAIEKFEINIENLGHNSTDIIEQEAIAALKKIGDIIGGTVVFSANIINFCNTFSETITTLDLAFDALRTTYLIHVQTLFYLSPTTNHTYYTGIFEELPQTTFAELLPAILEKYEGPHENLIEMHKKIKSLLRKAHADKDESPKSMDRKPIRRKDSKRDILKHTASESATQFMHKMKDFFTHHHKEQGTNKLKEKK